MNRESILRRRIWWLTFLFIIGLFLSGVTAMPLAAEVNWLVIDCSFGVLGFVPLWFCRRWVKELSKIGLTGGMV